MKINKTLVMKLAQGELEDGRALKIVADDQIKGFVARRLGSGQVAYGFRYRDKKTGKQRWLSLGLHGNITADEARSLAKKRAGEVADQRDPAAEHKAAREEAAHSAAIAKNTVNVVLDSFLARYAKGLRTYREVERIFKRYVRPRIGAKSIYELKRRDIVDLLDQVEDKNGPVMADRVLAQARKAFNWQATRDDQFAPPIVRGMARTRPADRARNRTLTDQEIRDVWFALDSEKVSPVFRGIVRALLLTAQRREEIARMHSKEFDGGTWIVPDYRYKTVIPHVVPMTKPVQQLIESRTGFIFSTTKGLKPFSGFSKAKRALDDALASKREKAGLPEMPHWTLHDLRRTARTLMSRAGVSADIAERVLGHKIPGVRAVYDRYAYLEEKRAALDALAVTIAEILKPVGARSQYTAVPGTAAVPLIVS
jgi:integrase